MIFCCSGFELVQRPDGLDHQRLVAILDQLNLVVKRLLVLEFEKGLVTDTGADDGDEQRGQQDGLAVRLFRTHALGKLVDVVDPVLAHHGQRFHQGASAGDG